MPVVKRPVTDAGTAPVDAQTGDNGLADASLSNGEERDTGVDTDSDGAAASQAVQHASCAQPAEIAGLPPPVTATDAHGRPEFDFFRDVSCAALEKQATCDQMFGIDSCVWCLHGQADDPGLCVLDAPCTGGGQVLTLRDGACRTCATIDTKAHACCANLPGFDCRAWPYPANSKVEELCARHEDCEPGLVCKQIRPWESLCLCPETNPVSVEPQKDTECRLMFDR